MKLATETEVLNRLNLPAGGGATANVPSITSALDAATAHLASILRTPLQLATRVDYFSRTNREVVQSPTAVLWLDQRFLLPGAEVYVPNAQGDPLGDLTGAVALDATDFYTDPYRGKVSIPNFSYSGHEVVAVKYSAGYEENSHTIPDWLRSAAIEAAIAIQHTQSIAHARRDKKEAAAVQLGMLYNTLNEHIITPYGGSYAVRSETL